MTIKDSKRHSDNPNDSKFCNDCGFLLDFSDGILVYRTEPSVKELIRGTAFAGRCDIIEEPGKTGKE